MKHIIATAVMTVALTSGAAIAHADGDAAAGKKFFKSRCTACHTADEGGKNKAGPNLFGVFGATAGQRVASFEKTALEGAEKVWDRLERRNPRQLPDESEKIRQGYEDEPESLERRRSGKPHCVSEDRDQVAWYIPSRRVVVCERFKCLFRQPKPMGF